jgi:hypothetical protein
MRELFSALLFFAVLAQGASADVGRVVTLVLPHALGAGETPWIEVKVGSVERGAEIEISTKAGQTLGVISPFGIRSGDRAGTYTIPLPPEAISDDHVSLRLTLNQYGHAKRAPTVKEVQSIRLKIVPAAAR